MRTPFEQFLEELAKTILYTTFVKIRHSGYCYVVLGNLEQLYNIEYFTNEPVIFNGFVYPVSKTFDNSQRGKSYIITINKKTNVIQHFGVEEISLKDYVDYKLAEFLFKK